MSHALRTLYSVFLCTLLCVSVARMSDWRPRTEPDIRPVEESVVICLLHSFRPAAVIASWGHVPLRDVIAHCDRGFRTPVCPLAVDLYALLSFAASSYLPSYSSSDNMIFGYSFKPAVQTVKWIGHLLVHPVRASLTFRVHSMTNALLIHAFCPSRILLQPPMSKQTLVVGGIALNVFSLSDADTQNTERPEAAGKKPIAVLFLLHGRGGDADQIELVAKAILDEVHSKRKDAAGKGASAEEETHDLWIVTFVSVVLHFRGVDWSE